MKLIEQDDKLTIEDPSNIEPEKQVIVNIEKSDGKILAIATNHSLSDEQITWFKAGSALNYIKSS
jgi:aconitate hydratase